jgi:hypothetical protein
VLIGDPQTMAKLEEHKQIRDKTLEIISSIYDIFEIIIPVLEDSKHSFTTTTPGIG